VIERAHTLLSLIAIEYLRFELADLPDCELSTTYSYRGHLSLQLINDPQAADNQLGAVVSATNACELVRAMDPYHRGKTDRLLVQNHQQSLNAWSHLDLSHLPQDRFAFYLDYSHGAYQPQGILTQASLEAAAYQYPLSVILQSQHLGTNEPEERNNFITTLSHYCDKQHPGNQNCLVEWIKTAINIDSNESEFAACKQYQALDSEFIDCLRQQTMTRLHSFVGKEIASLETRSHEFTHSYEGSHTIRLRDLSSGKTATIDVEDLFNTMGDRVSIHGMGGEQVSNYDHQRPWLSELTHGVINGLVPRAYAGAEIAACLAAGPAALECAAIDFVATIVVSVFIADNLAKADAENSQSHTSKNEISLSNNAEAGLAMQAAQSIENKHFHFCPNGDSVPVICDQNNPESSKISITQREDHFSILVILNDASPRLLEISTDHPSYHQIRSLYEGGQSQLQALIKNIIDLVQDQKRIAFEVDRKQYAINRNNLEDSYTVAWLRVSDDGAEEKVPLITIGLDHPLYTQTSALFPDPSAAQQASYVDNLINHIVSVQLSQLPEPDDQQTDPLSLQDNQALMNYNWEKQRLDLKFNAHKKHFFFPDSTIGTNVYIHNPRYVDSRYLVGQELTGQQQVLYEYLSQKAQEQSRPMFVTFLGGCLSCMQTAQKGKKKQEQGSIKVNPKDPSETKISVNAANILQKNDRRLCRVLGNPDKRRMEQEFYDYHANKAIGCFTIEILPIETEEGLRYTFSKWLNSDSNSEIWAIDCNLNSPHYHIMSFERDFTCTYTYQERKSITIFIVKEKENEDTDESNLPIRLNFQGAFAGNENIIAFKSLEPFGRNIEVLDSALMFKDASRLKVVQMNVDHSVNFELMFGEATNFTGLESNISAWQTENVRDMSQMFHNANHFEGDISAWQTENVIDMSHMFREATVFNSDISAWRTENVRHMSYMFYGTMLFMQDLHLWQVGRVQDHDWFYLQRVRFHDNFRVDDWPENHQPIFPN
jgi:surface protein